MKQLIIESWRSLPHSFAVINQFQCLELLRRNNIQLFHHDAPYFADYWKPTSGLFSPEEEGILRIIPPPVPDQKADVTLRLYFPFNLSPSSSRLTAVFGVNEFKIVTDDQFSGKKINGAASLQEATGRSDLMIITPSNWSREGFIRSGANPDRIKVVPHGVDPAIYRPLEGEERSRVREQLKWDDSFVFLNIGAMTWNKGISVLLKSFSDVLLVHAEARLILKGLDDFYRSRDFLEREAKTLGPQLAGQVLARLGYIGQPLSLGHMAQLYQAADAYVAPYFGEGFNLPVLEAMSCGLPVICTSGGSTDDFTRDDFALRIRSHEEEADVRGAKGIRLVPDQNHLTELMLQMIRDEGFRRHAHIKGPEFVQEGFTWRHAVDRLLDKLALIECASIGRAGSA